MRVAPSDLDRPDRGSAMLAAMFGMVVLSALGLGLIVMTNTEGTIASNFRAGSQTLYAADAAVERVMSDMLMSPSWNDILSGQTKSGFIDHTLTPVLPSNQPLDLMTLTSEIQAASNATAAWGANNPQWRLFAYGPLSEMAAVNVLNSDEYVVVWVSDDPSESDGDPSADTNGVMTVLAQAIGPHGSYRTIEVTVAKSFNNNVGQVGVRILSWREIR